MKVPSDGAVMATIGMLPRFTVTLAALLGPYAFVQETAISFAPMPSETELVVALPESAPPTVQVVAPGIAADPPTV